jgi:hypothetical protein
VPAVELLVVDHDECLDRSNAEKCTDGIASWVKNARRT